MSGIHRSDILGDLVLKANKREGLKVANNYDAESAGACSNVH